jgi:Flavin reductase like domain
MLAWPPSRNPSASGCSRRRRPARGSQPGPPDARAAVGLATVWTAGHAPGGDGLTVSSVLVAEGEPARPLGLIDPTSAFWEAMLETRAFVVHIFAVGDRALAERPTA